MSAPSALGFYAKHAQIMDVLADAKSFSTEFEEYANEYGLPQELSDLVTARTKDFDRLFASVYEELGTLENISLKQCVEKLLKEAGVAYWPGRDLTWGGTRFTIQYANAATARAGKKLTLGWAWHTEVDDMFLVPWVWMEGGRKAEPLLLEWLRRSGVAGLDLESAKYIGKDWYPGSVRLARINVSMMVDDDFALDLQRLCDCVVRSFSWISKRSLNGLFEAARSI